MMEGPISFFTPLLIRLDSRYEANRMPRHSSPLPQRAEVCLIHALSPPDIIGSSALIYRLLLLRVIRPVIRYSPAAHHSRSLQSACLEEKKRERVLPVVLINLSALICLYPPERSPRCGPTHTQQPHQHENMWRSPLIRPSTSKMSTLVRVRQDVTFPTLSLPR